MPLDPDIAGQLDQHRSFLLRIARLQLRDSDLAEDVVQETMLAALAGTGFSGRSSLRTWLIGILKHKVVDVIRTRRRRAEVSEFHMDAERDSASDEFNSPYDEQGGWSSKPADWGNPEQALDRRQFLDALELCLEKLPAKTARVFVMREYLELDVAEIAEELGITAGHLYVILYRARAALRQCLETTWFGGATALRA